jgi:hypothetical protein
MSLGRLTAGGIFLLLTSLLLPITSAHAEPAFFVPYHPQPSVQSDQLIGSFDPNTELNVLLTLRMRNKALLG